MIYYVDVDGTICENRDTMRKTNPEFDYPDAKPFTHRIEHINKLFDQGHEIVYWTARGTRTGKDWYTVTKNQLDSWGCKYHKLMVGNKPHFDLYVCDKSINADSFFSIVDGK